ncbi:hypothetical protein predicted by Glimmer/Critica [Acetobacter senegalensis]|uniref:Uncharacterized protein n=1 Tax=Acetobacter senegalensis TaxID=446692 RepID=A0A0U5ESJ9_9PROT|nr:hypothetical protein predicted by Glimmer/Critica [Acetobacter senegalensis]
MIFSLSGTGLPDGQPCLVRACLCAERLLHNITRI